MKLALIFSVGALHVSMLSFANPGHGMYLDPDKALHDWQV